MSWVRFPARALKENMMAKATRIAAAERVDRVTGSRPTGAGGRWRSRPPEGAVTSASAALDLEVGAPVLLHALLGVLAARRPLLAVRDRRHPVPGHAVGLEVIHGRLRPPIAERQVVLGGAFLVAVA